MKWKYTAVCVFVVLLILTIFSHANIGFSVVPGWNTVIYTPEYIIQISIILLLLLIAIGLYLYAAYKNIHINRKTKLIHILFSLPIIISLLLPNMQTDISYMSKEEIENKLRQQQWIAYFIMVTFIIGHFIFWKSFVKQLKLECIKQ